MSWLTGPFRAGSLRGVLTRLMLLAGVAVVALCGIAILGTAMAAREYRDAATDLLAHEDAANQVLLNMLNAQAGNDGYILTGRGDYLTPYRRSRARYEEDIRYLRRQVTGSPQLEDDVDEVDAAAERWFEEAQALIALRTAGQGEHAIRRYNQDYSFNRFTQFRVAQGRLTAAVKRENGERLARADRRRDLGISGAVAAALIALLMVATAVRQLWRRVGRPVRAINEGVIRVTRGRLSTPVPAQKRAVRELSELVDGFNDMQRQVFQQREAIAAAAHREAGQATERRLWETVQAGLLPEQLPAPQGLRVAARYQPAEKALLLGGDFYDAVRLADGRLALMVGDMAGHGAPAAARATGLRFAWRTLVATDSDPARVLAALNAQAGNQADRQEGLFASMLYAVVSSDGQVEYAPAGHPPPLVLDGDGCRLHQPDAWGPLLGVLDWADWPVTRLRLEPGDSMVLYTDGLIEARAGSELFGTDRACDTLESERTSPIEARVERLVDAARRYRTSKLEDDVVVLAVEHPAALPWAARPSPDATSGERAVSRTQT